MATRSSPRWNSTPGSFDVLHTDQFFPADDNPYGIPSLPHAPLSYTPDWIAPYRTRIRTKHGMSNGAVHFFLDDYRFETVWSRPQKALQYLRRFNTLLTPDFSGFAALECLSVTVVRGVLGVTWVPRHSNRFVGRKRIFFILLCRDHTTQHGCYFSGRCPTKRRTSIHVWLP